MKEIKLVYSNKYTLVDDDVYEWASKFEWYEDSDGYAVRRESCGTRVATIRLHNEVLGVKNNSGIDHKNRIKYDNRRENLRLVDQSTNQQNVEQKIGSSGFKGVSQDKAKWLARIRRNRKTYCLGNFDFPEDAARAYDKAALELYGPDALTNQKLGLLVVSDQAVLRLVA